MAYDDSKGAVTYDVEAAFCENATFVADWRLPVLDAVDVSGLVQTKVDSMRVTQRRNECVRYIAMQRTGSFKTRMYLTGRGSTGDNTVSPLGVLLGYAIGTAAMSRAADMTAGNDWDTDDGTVSASNGTALGSIFWFGAKRDGGGDGQPAVVSVHTGTQVDVLTALPAAPANASAIYASEMIYPPEAHDAAAGSITGLRFQLFTANQQFICRGCFARNITITCAPNELPTIEIEWGVSWWDEISTTFPDVTATSEFQPAPCAAGSLFFAARGTATRTTINYRALTISIGLGLVEEIGPNATFEEQSIVGVKRIPDVVTMEVTEDSQAASASPTRAGQWEADASYHLLLNLNAVADKRFAMYMPSCEFIADRCKQIRGGGINRMIWTVKAGTSTVTTTELTLSAYRFAQG